ncbi:copper amine oxidase-like protein [Aneurinibacillus soli]|uniref:Intracellular proteinase inhibitor n=2 Tax=Aneurinibacillus soli TaxID=1500254 RepID=A0A0U5AZ39_9BACL|nr:copper amine oxidase-like protein [Aneurinibacillus soli]BAU29034.1 Intracellular proteinase inhibitor [Aneurinibacillus soli]
MKRKHTRTLLATLALAAVAAGAVQAAPALTQIWVDVNPVTIQIGSGPNAEKHTGTFQNGEQTVPLSMLHNGTTYVPLRFVGDVLHKEVKWDEAERAITIFDGGQGGIVAGKLETVLGYDGADSLVFSMKNQTEQEQTLTFTSGKKFDYVIWNEKGEQVRQYSKDKMFTAVMSKLVLKQGQEETFTAPLEGLPAGTYKVKFWVTAQGADVSQTITFRVPAQK